MYGAHTCTHTHTHTCTRGDGRPSRGISPSASAISRFQATVLIRPQTSLPLLRSNIWWPAMPSALRQIVKSFIFANTFRSPNILFALSEESAIAKWNRNVEREFRVAVTMVREDRREPRKRDAVREQQVKVNSPRNNVVVRVISFPSSLPPPGIISSIVSVRSCFDSLLAVISFNRDITGRCKRPRWCASIHFPISPDVWWIQFRSASAIVTAALVRSRRARTLADKNWPDR